MRKYIFYFFTLLIVLQFSDNYEYYEDIPSIRKNKKTGETELY